MMVILVPRRPIVSTLLLLCSHVILAPESVTNAWTTPTTTIDSPRVRPHRQHQHHDTDRPSSCSTRTLYQPTRIKKRSNVSTNLFNEKTLFSSLRSPSSSLSSSLSQTRSRRSATSLHLASTSPPSFWRSSGSTTRRQDGVESTIISSPRSFSSSTHHTNEDRHDDATTTMSRRHVLLQTGGRCCSFLAVQQIMSTGGYPAAAVAAATTTSIVPQVVTTPATCDATVSVWRRDQRIIYLLGTAHISELSAQLAGQLVQDAHPQAVFVELDVKRVGGLLLLNKTNDPVGSGGGGRALEYVPKDTAGNNSGGGPVVGVVAGAAVKPPPLAPPRILVPISSSAPPPRLVLSSTMDAVSSSTTTTTSPDLVAPQQLGVIGGDDTTTTSPSTTTTKPSWFQQQLLSVAAATVGRALKSMYASLGDNGFRPGDEFRTAMTVAQEQGATIVLGDQDVQVTLQRLTQALQVTDWQKVQSPELEGRLLTLLPTSSSNGVNSSFPPAREDYPSNETYKKDLSEYVEKLKSRDSVRSIMSQLQEVAPALVQVMLTERDAYMARGLDTLQDYDVTVAVMGLAHQDGVERNLQAFGWYPVRMKCQ